MTERMLLKKRVSRAYIYSPECVREREKNKKKNSKRIEVIRSNYHVEPIVRERVYAL